MEALLERQSQIAISIERITTNFKKDSANRKTSEYLKTREETLNNLWGEFVSNNALLLLEEDKTDDYFTKKVFQGIKQLYTQGIDFIVNTRPSKQLDIMGSGGSSDGQGGSKVKGSTGSSSKSDELLCLQKTNFRALNRAMKSINIEVLSERWEIEDKLQQLQSRWRAVDELHWQIDNLLEGTDETYEDEFSQNEQTYEQIKTKLHRKLNCVKHQHEGMPHIELPTFAGNYVNWPTFSDLYCEAIHNNPTISKAQKMQHLKGKLKGEAERLVQHLTISAENYDTCWELLNRRYNNIQLLFTKQLQIFMNQPNMQKYTSYEIKRLHDVSLETVHAIHNLGVNTSTWDPILVHIITEKMDSETYTAYMDARKNKRDLPSFEELIIILEEKFTALEPLHKRNKQIKQNPPAKENEPKYIETRSRIAKTYYTQQQRACPLCKTPDHILLTCKRFSNMTPEAKVNTIKTLPVCENCLFYHKYKCTSVKKCKICNNAHHTILHEILNNDISRNSELQPSASTSKGSTGFNSRKSNHVAGNYDEVLLSTVELKVRARNGTYLIMRCLVDQGSQINLITEAAAQRLGLERCNQNASVFGVGTTATQSKGAVQLICESRFNNYTFVTDALVMPKVVGCLPNFTFEKQHWSHLHNISLADPDYNISRPIDVLLDAKVYAEILMDGILRGPINAPIAQQTQLGWILIGNVKTYNCHAVLNNLEEISQYWELEEITQQNTNMTPADEYCETLYKSTTTRQPDGRYVVRLPMKPNFEEHLVASKSQAVAQFKQLEKRFARNSTLANNYKLFLAEYEQLGHMQLCTRPQDPSCYLPHHGVIKLDSQTTKLRTVFNASSKLKSGYTLNDLMESGPNLQQDLQGLILLWRTFEFVYTADIEKFYRQIMVEEKDQHLQKIVWRNSTSDNLKDYQLCTVTYGTKAAPYLAMRTIKQIVEDDGHQYPLAVPILNKQLYVDDVLGGNNSIQEAKMAQQQIIKLLRGGGFNLRKWASNDPRLLEDLSNDLISQNMFDFKSAEGNKTLGLSWNPCTDQFSFLSAVHKNDNSDSSTTITKRLLLSNISRIFDPLGWLSPVTLKGKLLFQKVWTMKLNWDDKLPHNVQQEWETLKQDLPNIAKIRITRWIGNTEKPIELHGFCDASEKAFGCVIYCKSVDSNEHPMIELVAAKTKLAPLNKAMSLPRLELSGALLLSKLMKKVIDTINIQTRTIKIYGWTDSMVVLGWLQGDIGRWKTFVANRVASILESMPSACWNHVRSEDNAADCASRGLLPSQLYTQTLWWKGPSWLKEKELPCQAQTYATPSEETKIKQVCAIQTSAPLIETFLNKYSSMARITRVLGWVSRFIHCTRSDKNATLLNYLTQHELEIVHNKLIKFTQNEHFSEETGLLQKGLKIPSRSRILNLNPYLDVQGILRVGGRLQQAALTDAQKHPIILPSKAKLTELLIDQAHKTTLHGGASLTLTHLRDKYWILRGVRTVKEHILKCVRCHRFKTNNQIMAELPKPRVTPSRPFTHTGVDFTGQVEVKANKGRGIKTTRGYIAIFICLATKAVHLELVSDLSTDSFLAALKRLCARRGIPQHMYSDNGTNFVGAARVLKQEYKEALEHYINIEMIESISHLPIEWHFNAPAWPSAGGLWESAVKSMKHHMRRVLGHQKLTFEEFTTLLAQIEACLNSRPLVAITDDVDDLGCLTPGHFLVGGPVLGSPLSPDLESRTIKGRWQLTEKMTKDFWKKWSVEYLQTLQARSKWHHSTKNMEVGDVVLMKEDNVPPARWLLARITETHAGTDGRVRVVSLKTKNGSAKRPITKLSKLPLDEPDDHKQSESPEALMNSNNKPSRTKRSSNKIGFGSYFCTILWLVLMCITPSIQQLVNVTTLSPTKLIYFDKIANLQIVQDEWKMVVYYNVSTYWQSFRNIQEYVNHLNSMCKNETAFLTITAQFQHELNELKHYNDVMISEHGTRTKRGLINGVGYIANSLFGVLDERFAERYDKDIKQLQTNEDHLINLYKKHTSIIEGEYNLLKRNENVMNKQFHIINEHLKETEQRVQIVKESVNYIIGTALAANLVISNLRRVQQSLLDLVTDVRHGSVDTHLLKPDQFQEQLNIISGQLPNDLSLPCTNSHNCIREMYQLSRVHLRLTRNFLIFEVKVPLISNEQYELNKIIPIPHIRENRITSIEPTSTYLALNLKRDLIIPLNNEDLSSCRHMNEDHLLCTINLPTYDTKVSATICEAQIINNKEITACRSRVSDCSDKWLQLHNRGAWLYSCCKQCSTRIFCPAGMTSQELHSTGIITLSPGCMLKGENVIIHSHHMFTNDVNIEAEHFGHIQESSVNQILNNLHHSFVPEDHEETLKVLKEQIHDVKQQQEALNVNSSLHNTHYYTTYSVLGTFIFVVSIVYIAVKLRNKQSYVLRCCRQRNTNQTDIELGIRGRETNMEGVKSTGEVTGSPDRKLETTMMDRATSPFAALKNLG